MTDPIQFDAGTLLAADDDNLELTYALVPHGEKCRSNLGEFEVPVAAFSYPTDLTGMSVNLDHKREYPVAAFSHIEDQESTMLAKFRFRNDVDGRAAYADAKDPNGRRRHVSVEARDVVIKAGKAVSGYVFGAALVEKPAFASATLLATAADTMLGEIVAERTDVGEYEDVDGNPVAYNETSVTDVTVEGDTTTTTTTTVVEETPLTPPQDAELTPEEEPTMALPDTLTAGKAVATTTENRPMDLPSLFAALSRAKVHAHTPEDMTLLAGASLPSTLMAALSDVKISGSGSLPVGGAAIQPNWVGQLEQGITYQRQYVPLAKTGTNISAEGKKGFKVRRGTSGSPVDSYASTGSWAGNKAAIGSGTGFTEPYTSELHRFAFGDDIAREFYDLPGGAEVLAAYFSLIVEDHLQWSDNIARLAWIELAGAPTAASSAIPSDYPAALGIVMQAMRLVRKPKADGRRDKPTFVIVNDVAAEALDFTPFENIPNFVKFSWNLDGSGLADGDVLLVNGDTGIVDTASAIAGADYALELDELAGGPLWIDALNIANGGVDRAMHGYLQEFQVRADAVQMVGTGDTRANSTAYAVGRIIKASTVTYRVTVAGTTGSSAPSAPAVGATVTDGTATLLRLS